MAFRRNGTQVIRATAYRLCKLVTAFTPIIQRTFPSNAALLLALETANTACAVLVSELDAVEVYGD